MATLTLNIEVDTPGVGGLDTVTGKLKSMGDTSERAGGITTGIFQGIGQAVAGAGIGLVKAGIDMAIDKIGDSIQLASDKEEAASKVQVLFGESADIVTKASEGAAEAVGLSSGAYLTQAGNLGNLVTNLGFTGDAAADMSVDMLQLAGDMGSFNNADTSEVTEAMGAAFRGETEPIRRFGVMLDDASVKAKAVEMGLYSGIGAIDKNAKAQATYALILEQTTAAQGDFARTSDGLANSQKIAAAQMDDAWTRVGEALTPIAADLMPLLADAVVFLADSIGAVIGVVKDWIDDNKELVGQIQAALDATIRFAQVIGGAVIAAIGELAYRIGGLIGLIVDLAGALIDTGAAVVAVLSGNFEEAANAGQRALDRIGGFAENAQRAMGDVGRRAADEATNLANATAAAQEDIWADVQAGAGESLAEIPAAAAVAGALTGLGLTSGLRSNAPAVAGAADDMAGEIPAAVETASTEAAKIAAQTPIEIASGIRSARSAPIDAIKQLRDDLKNTLSPAKEIAQLEGQLHNKFLAKGMHSADPVVQAQAQGTLDVITSRLDELKGKATTAGQVGGAAVGTGLSSKDSAVRAAAASTTAVVTTQFNTLESGSRIAAQTANLTLASGLQAGTTGAANAGENVASAWGNALTRVIRGYRDDIAAAAAYATAPIKGMSPPKVGPLKDIDKWGENIGGAWSKGVSEGIGPLALSASPGGWPSGTGGGMGGGAPTIIVNAGVGDPVAIGREVVDAITAYERSGGRAWRET